MQQHEFLKIIGGENVELLLDNLTHEVVTANIKDERMLKEP